MSASVSVGLHYDHGEEIFHQIFISLGVKKYRVVRTNLQLSQHSMRDINRAYQTFVQEEQSRASSCDTRTHESVQTFLAQSERGKSRFERVDKSKLVCTHCKQRGNEVSGCFKIHDRPARYDDLLPHVTQVITHQQCWWWGCWLVPHRGCWSFSCYWGKTWFRGSRKCSA